MAKRKKLKNVVISNEELKPTTIGYLSSKQKGPFLLLFIFAVLFATLYFMPQITDYVNKIFNPTLYAETKQNENFVQDSTGVIESLTDNLVLNISGVKYSNFKVTENEMTFSVDSSKSTEEFSDYYLETYDRSKRLQERISIASTSISKVDLTYPDIVFVSISRYRDGNYPSVTLRNDTLTCTKSYETYEYGFNNNMLNTIVYKVSMNKNGEEDTEYDANLEKYTALASTFGIEGESTSLTPTGNGFVYAKTIDLQLSTNNTLENAYPYQAKSDMIAFEMSTKGYRCN